MSWLWTKFKGALYLLWIKLTYNDNHGIPTNFNANTTSLDPRRPLVELSQCTYKYCVNLDDQVFKDDARMLLRGGYATVYSGILCRGNEKIAVAIKTLRSGPPSDSNDIKNLLQEVCTWSKLHHPNILPLLGTTTKFEHTLSIVSPWMSKGNAHNYVQDKNVDPRPVIIGIAQGLHYLHNHKPNPIFHGDLKGVNVLISNDGRALLADFGFSYVVNSSFNMDIPCQNEPKGTMNWMSPELFDGSGVSAEADVWAFGMTTLELFTRKVPFCHLSRLYYRIMFSIMKGHLPERPTSEDVCSRMTGMWWDMCSQCWQREPSSRPKMAEIVAEIAPRPSESSSASKMNSYK